MPSLQTVKKSNDTFQPKGVPVAVITGATSGIGEALAKRFANLTGGNAIIILVGRNKAAAEKIIGTFPKPAKESGWRHEFMQCDVSLLKSVSALTKDILSRVDKINYLVLSAGYVSFQAKDDTAEGLDTRLVIRYYSRFAIVRNLLPLLRSARDSGEDAKVLSILAAGKGAAFNPDDFDFKSQTGTIGGVKKMGACAEYNDLMMEHFSRQEPGIGFTHTYPGFVKTPTARISFDSPILKPLGCAFTSMYHFMSITEEDSGEYMLYSLLSGPDGFYRRNWNGDDLGKSKYQNEKWQQVRKNLIAHSEKVVA